MGYCLRCGGEIPEDRLRHHAFYCSPRCAYLARRAEYVKANPKPVFNTATVGAIAELRVCLDLMNKGYEVFRAVSPASSCDLAILKDRNLLRVEVRTGRKSPTGKIYKSYLGKRVKADILATVLPYEIIYDTATDKPQPVIE